MTKTSIYRPRPDAIAWWKSLNAARREQITQEEVEETNGIKYPVRCRIIDVTGMEVLSGIEGATPKVSQPHIGKEGLAEEVRHRWKGTIRFSDAVRITLDDGNVLWGHDCWWVPLTEEPLQ
jgi:hypothetical protein